MNDRANLRWMTRFLAALALLPASVSAQQPRQYPFIDLDRGGIYGHSGGGNATSAAMLNYPHFFKVGIAESAITISATTKTTGVGRQNDLARRVGPWQVNLWVRTASDSHANSLGTRLFVSGAASKMTA